jgi:PE-PPE domain
MIRKIPGTAQEPEAVMRDKCFASLAGGWAVALGVGVAVASAPATAWAQPDTGDTSAKDTTSATGHDSTAHAEKPSTAPKTDVTARERHAGPKTHFGAKNPTPSTGDAVDDTRVSGNTIGADEHDVLDEPDPSPAVEESGDTKSVTRRQTPDTAASREPAGSPATASHERSRTTSTLDDSEPAPVTAEPPAPGGAEGVTELADMDAVDLGGGSVAPTAGARPFGTAARAAHATSASVQLVDTMTPTAEPPALTDPASSALAQPSTLLAAATGLIAAVFNPFVTPDPAQPAQAPMLWGLLEWARREPLRGTMTQPPIVQGTEQIDGGHTVSEDVTVNVTPTLADARSTAAATQVPPSAAAVLPTTVLTLAGAFSSSADVPPQLRGEITSGNTVTPVLYRNSDVLGWLFGDHTRPEYIADGVQKLNVAINTTPGPKVVFGDSLGAVVAQYWLAQYGRTSTVPADQLRFVLIGNSIRKYGGQLRSRPDHLAVANAVQVPGIRYQVLDIARQWDIYADYPSNTTSRWYSDAVNNAKAGDRSPYRLHATYENVDPDPDAPGNTKLVEGNWTYVWSRTNDLPLFYSSWNRFVYGVSGMTAAQRDQLWRPRIESANSRPIPIP